MAPDTPQPAPSAGGLSPQSSTTAQVVREDDRMRTGIDAVLLAISTARAQLRVSRELAVGELIKVRLRNAVQRCDKEVRGAVRKVDLYDDGSANIDLELFTRLTPLEVSMLKMGAAPPDASSGPKWV